MDGQAREIEIRREVDHPRRSCVLQRAVAAHIHVEARLRVRDLDVERLARPAPSCAPMARATTGACSLQLGLGDGAMVDLDDRDGCAPPCSPHAWRGRESAHAASRGDAPRHGRRRSARAAHRAAPAAGCGRACPASRRDRSRAPCAASRSRRIRRNRGRTASTRSGEGISTLTRCARDPSRSMVTVSPGSA